MDPRKFFYLKMDPLDEKGWEPLVYDYLFQIYFNETTPSTPTYEQFKAHAFNFRIYYPGLEYIITESPNMNT